MPRFTGLFHRMQRKNAASVIPEETFQLGGGEEEDVATLMTMFPMMQETMGLSLEDLEAAHNQLDKGSNFDHNFAIALERVKAERGVQ